MHDAIGYQTGIFIQYAPSEDLHVILASVAFTPPTFLGRLKISASGYTAARCHLIVSAIFHPFCQGPFCTCTISDMAETPKWLMMGWSENVSISSYKSDTAIWAISALFGEHELCACRKRHRHTVG